MFELKLKVFNALFEILKEDLAQNRAYDCLKVICSASINALEDQIEEQIVYSRYQLKAIVDGKLSADRMDSKDLEKWITDKKLNEYLDRVIQKHSKRFLEIGYVPVIKTNETVGGKGNERLFWLDIKQKENNVIENDLDEGEELVIYDRVDPAEIKISWFYKLIFRDGEIKNKSIRGLVMLAVIFGSFIGWALYICTFSLVLVRAGQNFTSFDLFLIFCLIGFSYLSLKYWFIPIWNLPEHRVIKAPMTFIALHEDHADIEMYRDKDRNQLTRITRFKGVCPVCSADVVLREGRPDQKVPLVGRCVESPFAHVYSFDRVIMKGKKLS